jgi:very-short-patch-repair endonuclease
MRKIIPYNPKLKELAQKLRKNSTKSEIVLWNQLKGKQIKGFSFHRQKPLLNYIADFYSYDLKLDHYITHPSIPSQEGRKKR